MSLYNQLVPKQKWAADHCLKNKATALFFEQGTGKTWITCGIIEKLLKEVPDFQCLIVVPLTNLDTTWVKTLRKVKGLGIYKDIEQFQDSDGPKVFLIHYEAMRGISRKLTSLFWDLVVFDESHRLKSRGGKGSRIAGRIKAEYRMILTGTPFDDLQNNPEELWSQFRFLVPSLFGTRWGQFDDAYLRRTGYMGYKRKFRDSMWKVFLRKIQPYCLRATKDEVFDLPPLIYKWREVGLYGKQLRIYNEMEKDSVTTVSGKDSSASLVITQLVKLQQITSGFLKDDQKELHWIGSAKLKALVKLVSKYKKPIVIFCKYLPEITSIETELSRQNLTVSTITGKNRKTRNKVIRKFQRGKTDVLIAQVRTGGVGVDLQQASVGIFYSTTFSYIDFEQAGSRLHRKGQNQPVTIILLCAKDTVDKDLYETVLSKRSGARAVFKRLRKRKQGGHKMAKKASAKGKKNKEEAAPTTTKKEQAGSKYGIKDLAELLSVAPSSARIKLRDAGVEKTGGRYGWDTKAELQEVVDSLKKETKKKPSKKADIDEDEEDDDDSDD